MAYLAAATSTITNLFPGECYPLSHSAKVSYTKTGTSGLTIKLKCSCGAVGMPTTPPPYTSASGTVTFNITHLSTGSGHRITTELTLGSTTTQGDEVTVSIGNPCPLTLVVERDASDGELAEVNGNLALAGTFKKFANGVFLLVEDPAELVAEVVPRPQLVFVAQAEVDLSGEEGKWSHPAIKKARKGQHLRVVLTKDGEVVSMIRAKFK